MFFLEIRFTYYRGQLSWKLTLLHVNNPLYEAEILSMENLAFEQA